MLLWLAGESNWYIFTATHCNVSVNGPLNIQPVTILLSVEDFYGDSEWQKVQSGQKKMNLDLPHDYEMLLSWDQSKQNKDEITFYPVFCEHVILCYVIGWSSRAWI